jgi:hypothetical protein
MEIDRQKSKSLTVAGLLLLFFSHTGTQSIQKCFTHLLHSKGQHTHQTTSRQIQTNIIHTSLKILRPPYKLALATGPPATILLLKNIPPRTLINKYSILLQPTQTLSYQGWIYMDAATPYLEDIHDLQRNIIHLHALRAIVICQHDAQEKQKHTAQQQLATMRAHMCSSPINIDIHAQEQHTHISQTDHSLRTLAIFTRHGRAIALFTLHATGKSLTTEGTAG